MPMGVGSGVGWQKREVVGSTGISVSGDWVGVEDEGGEVAMAIAVDRWCQDLRGMNLCHFEGRNLSSMFSYYFFILYCCTASISTRRNQPRTVIVILEIDKMMKAQPKVKVQL
jgi:hypothetical protein